RENLLATDEVRGRDVHLPVEAPRPQERRIEILQAVRRAHDDDLVGTAEPVELHEELVQGLILLAVEAAADASRADRVELVDEDDRRRILARLLEELPDPRRTEAREHLDEGGGAGQVEVRAGLVPRGLREEGLPGSRRAVEETALRHPRPESLELLPITQELDDLLQLFLRFVRA